MVCMNLWQVSRKKQLNAAMQVIHQEIMKDKDLQLTNDKKRLEFEASFNEVIIPSDSMAFLPAYTLIYVYTDTQCGKCITGDIALTRDYCKGCRTHFYPVIEDTRSNYAVLNSDLYDMNYTRLNKGTVVFPQVDGKSVRFMGIIDSEGEIVSAFYPSIASEEQKVQYLKSVKERYQLQKKDIQIDL